MTVDPSLGAGQCFADLRQRTVLGVLLDPLAVAVVLLRVVLDVLGDLRGRELLLGGR